MLRLCIPTYRRQVNLRCQLNMLRAAARLTDGFDVTVFDNASPDGTVAEFRAAGHPPGWELLAFDENTGAPGNCTRILHHAHTRFVPGDHLWILSDDDYVNPPAVAELAEQLRQAPTRRPVLLTFLAFSNGALRGRLAAGVPGERLDGTALFHLINHTGLLSAWLHPVHLLSPEVMQALRPFAPSEFFQFPLLALTLKQAGTIEHFSRPLGIEMVNLQIRARLRKAFAEDRLAALEFVCDTLALPRSHAHQAARDVATHFARRAVVWEAQADRDSAAQALDALAWFRSRGLLTPRTRALLLLQRALRSFRWTGLFNPLIRRARAQEERALATQKCLTDWAAPGMVTHHTLG